jgi:hypothetical protein
MSVYNGKINVYCKLCFLEQVVHSHHHRRDGRGIVYLASHSSLNQVRSHRMGYGPE